MSEWDTSKTLLMRVRDQGDDSAWQQFAETYGPFIFSILTKLGVQKDDAEDLQQEVIIKVWKALGDFLYDRDRCKFRTWLGRVARNTAYTFLKRKSKQGMELVSDEVLADRSQPSAQEVAEEKEWKLFIASRAWKEIQPLHNHMQLQVYSLMMEGKSADEVATLCGVKENTAYVYRKAVSQSMGLAIKRLSVELDG